MNIPLQMQMLLSIETSGRYGSVALAEFQTSGDSPPEILRLVERTLPCDRRSAQTLAPAIDALFSDAGSKLSEIGAVAVAVGPGSFTGLRVGVTTAKSLAYATGAALVAVGSLDALTEPHRATGRRVWGALDAQRGELFAALNDGEQAIGVLRVTRTEFLDRITSGDVVVGPVAESLGAVGEAGAEWVVEEPTAAAVARLGVAKLAKGDTVDPFQLVPEYHRVSAAEEKFAGG